MALSVFPEEVNVPASGAATVNIINVTEDRYAFKLKSGANQLGVEPICGFVEGGEETPLQITSKAGSRKTDKLVLQFIQVGPDVNDAKTAFTQEVEPENELTVKIK